MTLFLLSIIDSINNMKAVVVQNYNERCVLIQVISLLLKNEKGELLPINFRINLVQNRVKMKYSLN